MLLAKKASQCSVGFAPSNIFMIETPCDARCYNAFVEVRSQIELTSQYRSFGKKVRDIEV